MSSKHAFKIMPARRWGKGASMSYICYNCGNGFFHDPVVSDGTTHGEGWTYCSLKCYDQMGERIADWLS